MKRLFAVLVILVMVSAAVYSAGPFFGAKLGVGIGFHGNGKDMDDSIDLLKATISQQVGITPSVDEASGAAFVLSPYGGYYITDKLAVQGEFNFMIGQKKTWKFSVLGNSSELTGSYSSLDIPVLVKYEFFTQPALFGALAGPYISIPLGDAKLSAGGESMDLKLDGVTAGIAVGLYGGYPIGPGRIIGDIRFILDFNPVKAKESGVTMELLKRRGLNITAGYEISLGKK
ncbi:MAG: PorT family protein [Spirochaetaceae bacterium]|nr:PorT family protein [Spirochaetaceae bacterium]